VVTVPLLWLPQNFPKVLPKFIFGAKSVTDCSFNVVHSFIRELTERSWPPSRACTP